MSQKLRNEKMKRKYFRWLREARGLSESTISAIEKAIGTYEDFTDDEDFGKFGQRKAIRFKEHLLARKYHGKPLSATTVYHYLRNLKDFLAWLSEQPGYKSKIHLDCVSYLSLEKKLVREATSRRMTKIPSLAYVKNLCESIEVSSNIDMRDRAIIAFLLLSGMRDSAIATLPLGCYDPESHIISQDPSRGVATKFSKCFYSVLLPFDEELVRIVDDWSVYLSNELGFGSGDPLFPRTKIEQIPDGCSFIATGVEARFWSGGGPIRRILLERSKAAGIDYYKPHSFRHAAIQLAMKFCGTAEDIKALSQNFGHENVGTTMMTYGKLRDQDVLEVVRNIDFTPTSSDTDQQEVVAEMERLLKKMKKN